MPSPTPGAIALIGASALALALYFVLDGAHADVVWNLGVVAVMTIATVAVARMPDHRLAWALIVAGQWCFIAGDLAFSWFEHVAGTDPFPSFADAWYLAGYPTTTVGLLVLVRSGRRHRDIGALIDTAILTIAAGAVLWVFVMDQSVSDSAVPLFERLVAVAYPAGDVLVLSVLALLAMRGSGGAAWFRLLTAALVAMLLADIAFALMALHSTYAVGSPVDALWWASYVLVTLAAMHHRDAPEAAPDDAAGQPLTGTRLGALAVAALTAPTLLLADVAADSTSRTLVLRVATIAMFVLVVGRLQLIARELDWHRDLLHHQATHDPLTGVANRSLLTTTLTGAIRGLGRHDELTLLWLDLDDFKSVNDVFGHAAGDALLRTVAERLRHAVRPADLVARLGGDEFAILLHDTVESGQSVATRLLAALDHDADVGAPVPIRPQASIGIAPGRPGMTADQVLSDADAAMYSAKRAGEHGATASHPTSC